MPSGFTVKPVAKILPNITLVAPVKFWPLIVTSVPPAVGPALGDTLVTTGRDSNGYRSAAVSAEVPRAVTTVTSTVPAASPGTTAVIEPFEFTVNEVAATPSKKTALAPLKPLRIMVFVIPAVDGLRETEGPTRSTPTGLGALFQKPPVTGYNVNGNFSQT